MKSAQDWVLAISEEPKSPWQIFPAKCIDNKSKVYASGVKLGHEPLRICHLICRWRQIHSSVDDFSFDFLRKVKESFFDEFVSDVKQKQRMQDVIL